MDAKTLVRHELIGLECEVIESKARTQVGIRGRIVDETRNTLVVETRSGRKRLIKDQVVLVIYAGGKRFRVPGTAIIGRPEDRIKKKIGW